MSMTGVRQIVEAPTRVPYRHGLFSVLDFQPNERGGLQLAWDSIGCSPAQVAIDPCLSEAGAPHTKVGSVDCENVGGETAFTVIAYDDSSLGRDRAVSSDRARQKLLLGEQYVAEQALTGAIQGIGATNETAAVTLPKAATATASELWLAAVGGVEKQIAERGGEGIVLAPRAAAPILSDYISATGSVLRTKLGTPIAFLAGWEYTTFPNGILGVTAMVALRSDIARGNGWNTEINDHSEYAERDYALGWECDAVVVDPLTIV